MQIKSKFFIYVSVLSLSFCGVAASQDSSSITITIDTLSLSRDHPLDTIDFFLSSQGRPVGGIDIKFGFDTRAISILAILQGEIPDSCDWKIFNSREAIESGSEGFPRSMWQILTLAEFGPDTVRTPCHGFDRTASIARLIVSLDTSQVKAPLPDTILPIYFFWEDCTDNTITDVGGDSLFISVSVDKLHSTDPSVLAATFPTRLGAPSRCINPSAKNPPIRRVAFQNGGVRVRTVVDTTD